ncbi:MAG: SDR family oxidoreductase [Geminicoccaceae bacterium]
MRVGVLGATGRIGGLLVHRLVERGVSVVGLYRDARRAAELPSACDARRVNLDEPESLRAALRDVDAAVSVVPPALIPTFIAGLPASLERVVVLASARRYTRFPDARAEAVRLGEEALARSGHRGVFLNPTMIYGARGENNVQQVADIVRRFGVVPLPLGGNSLVQPIYVLDVVACLEAGLFNPSAVGPPRVIAGPSPVTWAEFVRAIAAAAGRRVRVVPIPVAMLRTAAWLTRHLPGIGAIGDPQVRRLLEDKDFSIEPMQQRLGIVPISLAAGLAETFAAQAPQTSAALPAAVHHDA